MTKLKGRIECAHHGRYEKSRGSYYARKEQKRTKVGHGVVESC